MNKIVTEFIGTFFLVLVVILTCNNGSGGFAPLAICSILVGMIFACGHISKAYFNPAVTLAFIIRSRMNAKEAAWYIFAQLLAGFFASAVGVFLLHSGKYPEIVQRINDPISALVAELLGTFALVWVILNVATTKINENNSFYGVAIGFTVAACAYALGPVSGGVFNPAVAVGFIVTGMASASDIWIYLVGSILGSAAAATVFSLINEGEF
jgi:aquaporin Z